MNASLRTKIAGASRIAIAGATLATLLAAPTFGQDDVGEKAKAADDAAAAPAPAGGSMDRLQGAAGVGAAAGVGEAAKGGALGGAAKTGGSAAVQDYMKAPGAGAGTAGEAPPDKGGDAKPEEAPE